MIKLEIKTHVIEQLQKKFLITFPLQTQTRKQPIFKLLPDIPTSYCNDKVIVIKGVPRPAE